jgi:beta-galactosidase/beta-glucuronidase
MSTLHTIRLRGPWEYTVQSRIEGASDAASALVESNSNLPPSGRIVMPATWAESLGPEFRGRVEYRRRFGRPTGITPNESVWLVCDGAEASAAFSLNGDLLGSTAGPDSPAEFDVTTRLTERNELVAVVECTHCAGGLTGEVRLEIRPQAT